MSRFNYQDQLQVIHNSNRLAEIRFIDNPGWFTVAYILGSNQEFLTLLEITEDGEVDGICIYPLNRVSTLKVGSDYLKQLAKKIKDANYQVSAQNSLSQLKELTFDGFLAGFKGSNMVVEVALTNKETYAGQVLDFNNEVILINEFDEGTEPPAQTVINRSHITRLAIEIPWTKDISVQLASGTAHYPNQ